MNGGHGLRDPPRDRRHPGMIEVHARRRARGTRPAIRHPLLRAAHRERWHRRASALCYSPRAWRSRSRASASRVLPDTTATDLHASSGSATKQSSVTSRRCSRSSPAATAVRAPQSRAGVPSTASATCAAPPSDAVADRAEMMRARAMQKYVGDYTLFMTGLFRTHVESRGALGYYVEEGQRSYRAVSELDLDLFRTGFLLVRAARRRTSRTTRARSTTCARRISRPSPARARSPSFCDGSKAGSRAGSPITEPPIVPPASSFQATPSAPRPISPGAAAVRQVSAAAGSPQLLGVGRRPRQRQAGAQRHDRPCRRHDHLPSARPQPRRRSHLDPAAPCLYEDADLVAIDKPPGLAHHARSDPARASPRASSCAIPRWRRIGDARPRRSGASPRHRDVRPPAGRPPLRTPTRNCGARSPRKAVAKDYLAVVAGRLAEPQVVTHAARPPPAQPRSHGPGARLGRKPGRPGRRSNRSEAMDDSPSCAFACVRASPISSASISRGWAIPIVGDTRYGPQRCRVIGRGTLTGLALPACPCAFTFDDPALPRGLATPFPAHWRPLFAARGGDRTGPEPGVLTSRRRLATLRAFVLAVLVAGRLGAARAA